MHRHDNLITCFEKDAIDVHSRCYALIYDATTVRPSNRYAYRRRPTLVARISVLVITNNIGPHEAMYIHFYFSQIRVFLIDVGARPALIMKHLFSALIQ